MTEQTISQQASVAPTEATLKRAIQMKMFATNADKVKVQLAFEDKKSPTFQDAPSSSLTVGQIIGQLFAVQEKTFEGKDGATDTSLLAVGDFEAVIYETGESISSTTAYLPRYYLETAKAMMEAGAKTLDFAIEIVLVPTGKSIPISYEVRNLIRRAPENRLNQIKRELAASGRLRLSPPVADLPRLEGEVELLSVLEQSEPAIEPDDAGTTAVDAEANSASQADGETGKGVAKGDKVKVVA